MMGKEHGRSIVGWFHKDRRAPRVAVSSVQQAEQLGGLEDRLLLQATPLYKSSEAKTNGKEHFVGIEVSKA